MKGFSGSPGRQEAEHNGSLDPMSRAGRGLGKGLAECPREVLGSGGDPDPTTWACQASLAAVASSRHLEGLFVNQ